MNEPLRFPALGAVISVPIFDAEKAPEKAGVKLRVRLVGNALCEEWRLRSSLAQAQERRRLALLRVDLGDDTPEETIEGAKALLELSQEIAATCIAGIEGVDVGEQSIDEVADPQRMVAILDHLGWLRLASLVAATSQRPTAAQNLSSGS
jgi:hypothetical protein